MKDEHELGIKIFKDEKENWNEKELEPEFSTMDTKCGIGCFTPKWLQFFASKKTFVVVYALAGMQHVMMSSYNIGTVSTVEKNFNMSSRMIGIISATSHITSMLANLLLTYIAGKGHRTRWIALGLLVISISCFMRTLPYHIYGGGENIKLYTKEYESSLNITHFNSENTIGNTTGINVTYLRTNVNCDRSNAGFSDTMAFYIFLTAQLLVGIGSSVHWTCGSVYLDDNVRKNVVPILLGFVQAIALLGPTIGFFISSFTLKIYVDPHLTPTITHKDPRWIGAWWMGWYPIGIFGLVCASALALFPKILPRAAMRKALTPVSPKNDQISFSDFANVIKRLIKNKIVVFNSLSSVSYFLGILAFWTFMPKYLETQFRFTPSQSSFLTGSVGILTNALGVVTSGFVISKFKPSPRFLAGWNVLVEFIDVLCRFAFILLSCDDPIYHGHWNTDNSWNLTEICNEKLNCGTDIQYAPVCDSSRNLVFYSPCHAGCTMSSMINSTKIYNNCSCAPNAGMAITDGLCPVDCSLKMKLLFAVMLTSGFTSATGRSANTLIQFRSVDEKDKSMAIGLSGTLLNLLALMPAPILYGIIMDWTCIVWGDKCGSRGNCWIYDGKKLRLSFNLTAAGFMFIGTILDCFVWYYVKGMKIYDEDFMGDSKNNEMVNLALAKKFKTDEKLENSENELSPI